MRGNIKKQLNNKVLLKNMAKIDKKYLTNDSETRIVTLVCQHLDLECKNYIQVKHFGAVNTAVAIVMV